MTSKVFGKQYREDFPFDNEYTPMSHGAYGSYPKSMIQVVNQYREQIERNPDRFIRFEASALLQNNLEKVAPILNCSSDDIVFSANSTAGINSILRSFPFQSGEKILYYQTVYSNCSKILEFLKKYKNIQTVCVDLNYPIEDDEVLRLTREAIENNGNQNIKLCLLDAISSTPGVCKPFKKLVKLLKNYGIKSLVDGAHAIGQIELNIKECDPDFFVTNCHKWLFTPRGCAVVYVARRNQGLIHPSSINYAYQHHMDASDGSSFKEEHYPGTVDLTSYLTVGAAINYRESIGGEKAIREYTHKLAVDGGETVAKMLNTRVMENSTKTLTASMVNIELPIPKKTTVPDSEIPMFFMKKSIFEHNTSLAVYKNNEKWWVRLCAQIYLDLDDFKLAGDALLKLLRDLE